MSLADQLFHEIQSESLQQLLLSVQQDLRPIETGISAFDSGLFQATHSGLHPGDVIHIHGPSGAGKTQLLYRFLVACCMPPEHLLHQLGGWNKIAFVLDMDGTFDIGRFHEILVARWTKSDLAIRVASVIDGCLKRVHVFRPTSTEQLATTLAFLPKYHAKNCPDAVMGMVAIHSLDTFHWVDQFKAEQLPPSSPRRNAIFANLEALGRSYGTITIISYWGLPRKDDSPVAPSTSVSRAFHVQLSSSFTIGDGPSTKAFVAAQDRTNSFSFKMSSY